MSALRGAIRAGGERVARLDRRPRTRKLLRYAIPHAIPRWFDPSAALDLDATIELRIRDRSGEALECFLIRIADQRCAVTRADDSGAAGAVVTIGAEEMIRAASGAVGWPELLSNGSLVLTGDPFLALRFPSLFRLPVDPHLG